MPENRRPSSLLPSFALALAFASALVLPGAARADEVRVLAAGAARRALQAIAPAFEAATGHRVMATFDTVGAQRDRVLHAQPGAAADVVVLSESALAQLRAAGRLVEAPVAPVGQVLVSLAVPAGRPLPDVSDAEHLRSALLAATSIAYADPARGATAGTHFARTVDALGIRERIAARTSVLPFGGDVVDAVAQGRYAIGVSQSSEIMGHAGVQFAGALPAPYARGTGYGAALTRDSAAGRALMQYLGTPPALQAFRDSGFSR